MQKFQEEIETRRIINVAYRDFLAGASGKYYEWIDEFHFKSLPKV